MLRHLADWVKTCHCLRPSWVSQIHDNCQVTHHPDTQDVRETGLMIHIPQQSTCTWPGLQDVCAWSSLEKDHSFPLLSSFCCDGRLRCQKCLNIRDIYPFQHVCKITWHKLIISSGLKREQLSSCVSMSFLFRYCRDQNIWKGKIYIYLSIYIKFI